MSWLISVISKIEWYWWIIGVICWFIIGFVFLFLSAGIPFFYDNAQQFSYKSWFFKQFPLLAIIAGIFAPIVILIAYIMIDRKASKEDKKLEEFKRPMKRIS